MLRQVLIISYETFRLHAERFAGDHACDLLICDEAHRLKSDQTLTSKVWLMFVPDPPAGSRCNAIHSTRPWHGVALSYGVAWHIHLQRCVGAFMCC